MNHRSILVSLTIIAVVALLACAACTGSPATHHEESEVISPSEVDDFKVLYGQNCAGCHGVEGKGGAGIALANPVFLAIADDNVIRRTAANGIPGTPMPAFAQSAGGMLTDKQIDALVQGIRSWANPEAFKDITLPPYSTSAAGDSQRGVDTYRTYCSSCHGVEGRGGKASSIVDGKRSTTSNYRDCRPARVGRSGLAG
jgi:mono/diheme cytochrome c family protein